MQRKTITMAAVVFSALLLALTATGSLLGAVQGGNAASGPTEQNALSAEQQVARALLANDAAVLGRLLGDDWVVVNTYGGVGDRAGFLEEIRSGAFTRKTLDLSDARVRIYGNTAVVTSKLQTSGTFRGKSFDIQERQTDVLIWRDDGWKSVLTHETQVRAR